MKEYVNGGKRNVSSTVLSKIRSRKLASTLIPENKYFTIKMKINTFISDILVLFTDFEEDADIFGDSNLENYVLEPEELEDDFKRN